MGSFSSESRPREANAEKGRSRLAVVVWTRGTAGMEQKPQHTLGLDFGDILAASTEDRISGRPTCVLGLFTKAPVFLVKALREWTGSVGEALRLPSSLLTSPLCRRPSSSPLESESHRSVHASLVLPLFMAGITSYRPAARCVGYVLKMSIGSVRGLGGNQHHPTLLSSIQHLRKSNNNTFKMLKMENRHLRFCLLFG